MRTCLRQFIIIATEIRQTHTFCSFRFPLYNTTSKAHYFIRLEMVIKCQVSHTCRSFLKINWNVCWTVTDRQADGREGTRRRRDTMWEKLTNIQYRHTSRLRLPYRTNISKDGQIRSSTSVNNIIEPEGHVQRLLLFSSSVWHSSS